MNNLIDLIIFVLFALYMTFVYYFFKFISNRFFIKKRENFNEKEYIQIIEDEFKKAYNCYNNAKKNIIDKDTAINYILEKIEIFDNEYVVLRKRKIKKILRDKIDKMINFIIELNNFENKDEILLMFLQNDYGSLRKMLIKNNISN